ncbi:MAG: hypothetical protein J5685_06745, partial [Clostridiales bacterium]|nr:hypothetical protein [Clostridiales bacterium]
MDNDSRIDPQEDPVFRESKTEYIPAQEEKTVYIPEEPEPAAAVHSDETEAASEKASKIRLYPDGSWDCTCGLKNKGRFCSQCGQQRPAAAESRWVCSCGLMNTANYCSGCGKAKPVQRSVFRNLGNTDSRPRQAPPPLTFEDREKIKDVYKKVKKRYATGCTVSVVMCSVTSIFTIIMMVYYDMVYFAEHGRHGAQSLTEFISIWTYSLSGLVLIPSLITL